MTNSTALAHIATITSERTSTVAKKSKSYFTPTRNNLKFGDRVMHPSAGEVQVVGGFIFGTVGQSDVIRYRKCLPSGKVSIQVYQEKSWIL